MLEIKSKDREGLKVSHQGDPVMVAVEIAMAINVIYNAFSQESVLVGEMFKGSIQASVTDDSPTWGAAKGVTTVKIDMSLMQRRGESDGDS